MKLEITLDELYKTHDELCATPRRVLTPTQIHIRCVKITHIEEKIEKYRNIQANYYMIFAYNY